MSNYDLDRLGHGEFEDLVQALLKMIIGLGTITFGDGPDGGREATYSGKAPYPSQSEQWEGEWVFQAKYHNTRQVGPEVARRSVLNDLKSELQRITGKSGRRCDNYILATNVPLSSVPRVGTHDRIAREVVPEFLQTIQHIHVWGYDDISRFLDTFPEVRQSYFHLISPGDLIAELMDRNKAGRSALAEVVQLYAAACFDTEQYAQLDQAGDVAEKPIPLRRVFIDLFVQPRSDRDVRAIAAARPDVLYQLELFAGKEPVSATQILISPNFPKTVLIGGPGQGKSTLGQFVAQIHRAYLLGRVFELNGIRLKFTPVVVRVPFRVVLKDYAQWIADSPGPHNVESFLSVLVEERAGRGISGEQIQQIIKLNPCLFVFDGLDEVTDETLREQMLRFLAEFLARCEDALKADMQVVATSRPTGYSDQFHPSQFLHLTLAGLDARKVAEYTERWIKAKGLDSPKAISLRSAIKDCVADPHFSALMNTPLQVTIFILIVLSGGTPPRQREELFNEYLEVIYKRERAKSKTIIQTEKRLLFGLHQHMGYLLHGRAAGSADTRSRMKEEEFAAEVFRYLSQKDPYSDRAELRAKADRLIKEARERLVLIVSPDRGFFGFELRSIQEFFAAAYLVETARDHEQLFQRFQAISLSPHWRYVALFFAGRVGRCNPGTASSLLEACRDIDRQRPDRFAKRGGWLAADIAVDRSFGPDRILQRSAIEFALTVLETDLDRQQRLEFVGKVKQLPAEDVEHLVLPLLRERAERLGLPEGAQFVEALRGLAGQTASIVRALSTARMRRSMSPEGILERILEYRLPAADVASVVLDLQPALSEDDLVDLLVPYFCEDPGYVDGLLKVLSPSEGLLKAMFAKATQCALRVHRVADHVLWDVSTEVPRKPVDQIRVAFELLIACRQMSLEFVMARGVRYAQMPREVVDWVRQTAVRPSAMIELRSAALSFLSKRLLFSSDVWLLNSVYQQFIRLMPEQDRELVESILFRGRAPSLEMMSSVLETSQRRAGVRSRRAPLEYSRGLFWRELELRANEVGLLRVLDLFDNAKWGDILGSEWDSKRSREATRLELLRIGVRVGMFGHMPVDVELGADFLPGILDEISRIAAGPGGASDWQAWAALARLSEIRWGAPRGRRRPFLGALDRLCSAMESRVESLAGRWEICGLVLRCAELGKCQDAITRLLDLLARIPEGRLWDRESHLPQLGGLDPGVVVRVGTIAKSQHGALCGFSRLVALTSPALRRERGERLPKLAVDKVRLLSILKENRGLTAEGALLLLAQGEVLSVREVAELVQSSKGAPRPLDRGYAELVSLANVDSAEGVGFLEAVLAGDDHPKAVKYAALDRYRQVVRGTVGDIKGREQELGLP